MSSKEDDDVKTGDITTERDLFWAAVKVEVDDKPPYPPSVPYVNVKQEPRDPDKMLPLIDEMLEEADEVLQPVEQITLDLLKREHDEGQEQRENNEEASERLNATAVDPLLLPGFKSEQQVPDDVDPLLLSTIKEEEEMDTMEENIFTSNSDVNIPVLLERHEEFCARVRQAAMATKQKEQQAASHEATEQDSCKTAPCEVCGEMFSKQIMWRHMRTHAGAEMSEADSDCGVKDEKKREKSVAGHGTEKPYMCGVCDYRTARRCNLACHVRTHTGEKPFKCDVCDFRCARSNTLTLHVRTHTGDKPYKCEVCDYRSTRSNTLTIHVRTHTGDKPYKCEVCDYRCARSNTLVSHVRKHTRKKPYKCDVCDYRSARNNTLTLHMRTHNAEKPFKCNVCNYRSAHSSNLARHMRTHSAEKP